MKNLFLFLAILLIPFIGISQETVHPNLEYIDHPYFWSQDSDSLILLQKENSQIKNLMAKAYHMIPGETSNLKLDLSGNYKMLIQVSDELFVSAFTLYKLDIKNANREAKYWSVAVAMGNKVNESIIPFNVKKIDEKYYEIEISEELEKGQYGFIKGSFDNFSVGTTPMFTFYLE